MTTAYQILYVDDEPAVCRSFVRALANVGFSVTSVCNPEKALILLQEKEFDILASDYRMPHMNGIELLKISRKISPNTKRILTSGYCDVDVIQSAINIAEINHLLIKPWDYFELLNSIKNVMKNNSIKIESDTHSKEESELLIFNKKLGKMILNRTTNLLDSLICALDFRDTETQWHSRRVAAYAKYLANFIGLHDEILVDVERGALLHDIGKIGISDSTLFKPGKLNEIEWLEMKRHPMLGYEILSNIDFLSNSCLIILQHQEQWDGGGYPAALKGYEICIGARIFHIVDAYDAITSDRPYRSAQSYLAAKSEIIRCSNTQFDPELVSAWCKINQETWDFIKEKTCINRPLTKGF